MNDLSISVFNGSDGMSRVNITTTLKVDLLKVSTMFSLMGKTYENSKEFDHLILKGNIDSCKVSNGTFGNFIVQMIAENLEKYSNFRFECPLKKADFYAINFPVDMKYIPYYFLANPQKWELTSTIRAKVKNTKSLVLICTIKFYGVMSD